jgi:hypothetical protein
VNKKKEMLFPSIHLRLKIICSSEQEGNTIPIHTPEAETPVDKLYAQVDKKRKKGGGTIHPHTPEAETAVNQDGDLRSHPSLRVYAFAHVDMSSCNLLKTCIQVHAYNVTESVV